MQSDYAVKADNVEKIFRLPYKMKPKNGLHKIFNEHKEDYFSFHAINPVSFEIYPGETFGIIGANGSGKTTLLQLIAGLTQPSKGKISVNGRISAIMELGSGFNPAFTGRENILINGLVMGLSKKEIEKKFDEIVHFSGIGDFVEQPVSTYSSGMLMKLAFSLATSINPDVIVIDEVLAVGDAEFQPKCYGRINSLRLLGKTLAVASHNMELIKNYCQKAIYLKAGRIKSYGPPDSVVGDYEKDIKLQIEIDRSAK